MNEERVYAKSLKLADDEIICPYCNAVLVVPKDIIHDEFIQCSKCDAAIVNLLVDNQKILTVGIVGLIQYYQKVMKML